MVITVLPQVAQQPLDATLNLVALREHQNAENDLDDQQEEEEGGVLKGDAFMLDPVGRLGAVKLLCLPSELGCFHAAFR